MGFRPFAHGKAAREPERAVAPQLAPWGLDPPGCLLKSPQPVLRERSEHAIGELLEI